MFSDRTFSDSYLIRLTRWGFGGGATAPEISPFWRDRVPSGCPSKPPCKRRPRKSCYLRDSEISKHPRVGVRGRAQPAPEPPPWGGVEGPKAPPHLPRNDLDFPDPL